MLKSPTEKLEVDAKEPHPNHFKEVLRQPLRL